MPPAFTSTGKLLAVMDDVASARAAVTALEGARFSHDAVVLLEGTDAADAIGGKNGGRWSRLNQAVAFWQADQAVDLATYEAAVRDGRAVIAVRIPNGDARERAVKTLRGSGAHFINYYGRLVTEDIVPWRGERPDVSWRSHR